MISPYHCVCVLQMLVRQPCSADTALLPNPQPHPFKPTTHRSKTSPAGSSGICAVTTRGLLQCRVQLTLPPAPQHPRHPPNPPSPANSGSSGCSCGCVVATWGLGEAATCSCASGLEDIPAVGMTSTTAGASGGSSGTSSRDSSSRCGRRVRGTAARCVVQDCTTLRCDESYCKHFIALPLMCCAALYFAVLRCTVLNAEHGSCCCCLQ